MTALLRVQDVTKSYGRTVVLRAVSFELHPGEVLGVLGSNGSGKTTLLRAIAGIEPSTNGHVTLEGASRRLGALLDPTWLDTRMTCTSHAKIALIASRGVAARGAARAVLEQVGLLGAGPKRVRQLSLGMRQRLALGLALLDDPSVLLLDEPLNGLDPDGVLWMRDLIQTFARAGGAVILSSHLLAEMEQVATRVVALQSGQLVDLEPALDGSRAVVEVQATSNIAALRRRLVEVGAAAAEHGDMLVSEGIEPELVFQIAVDAGIVLKSLIKRQVSLEERYRETTAPRG